MKTSPEISIVQHAWELDELISVFEDVFEMVDFKRPGQAHLESLLKKDSFFAVVAKFEKRIIGGLTAYVLDQYYSARPLAYIYDLAVKKEFQRQGVGGRLMAYTNDHCRKQGFEGVFVQAEKEDVHAIDFYRSTKPTGEKDAIDFSYNLSGDDDNNTFTDL